MKLVRFGAGQARAIPSHDSEGFTIAPIAEVGEGRITCARLEPGGSIGRHPAACYQLLAIVSGEGVVSGGVARRVAAGDAVVWETGEEHETHTDMGLTAIIVEGDALEVLAPE